MKTSPSVPIEAVKIYNNALAFSNKGDFEPALNEYNRAISMYPTFVEAYNNIGEIYSKIGDAEKAISSYMDALRINRHHKVLLNLGVEYYNKKQYTSALSHFVEAISLKKDFIEGNFYAAMVQFNLMQYNSAEKYFNKVIEIDHLHIKANYLLAFIYYERKNYKKTIQCLDRIKDIADDKMFVNRYYGFCFFYLKRYDEAFEYLSAAMKYSPGYTKFKKYLKSLTYENKLKEIGDVKKKINEVEKQMTKSKKPSIREYTHLSMLYIFEGEYKKAENLLTSLKVS